ncbi:MAG TPA: YggT family protein [Thermomicrobiales bacterium]|nr:YggT family protein [Thermomicrobiales bacterium]
MGFDLVSLLLWILNLLSLLLLARAIFSWFDPGFTSTIGRAIHDITEPILAPIRQVLPPMGMLDLSTIVGIILIQIISRLIVSAV